MKTLYLLCLILYAQITIAASETTHRNNLNTCKPTHGAMNDYEPKKFQPGNNLLRSAGALPIVCGQRLIIKGKLLDSKCVPVSDAKVYLWQVGCDGKYPYNPLRNIAKKHHINLDSASSFLGSGVATTDNNGEFQFVTIYPHKSENGKHVINIRAEHRDIGDLQTQIMPSAGSDVYDFTMVMHEQNPYRRY